MVSDRCLQVISYIPAQEDDDTTKADDPKVVLAMVFMAYQHTAKIVEPSAETCHLSAAFIPPKGAAILGFRRLPVRSMRRDQRAPWGRQCCIARVTIVGLVADRSFRLAIDKTRGERGCHQGDCVWRSSRNVDGARKTSAVGPGPDLCPVAPRGLSPPAPPWLATTKVPSMNHADRSSPPRSRRSAASVWRTRAKTPERTQCEERRWQG
jgi:hypothetical protein